MNPSVATLIGDDINKLLSSFQAIKKSNADGTPPTKHEAMSIVKIVNEVTLTFECNPNIFPDPFKAEVFVRVQGTDVDVSSQCMLPKLIEGIKEVRKAGVERQQQNQTA